MSLSSVRVGAVAVLVLLVCACGDRPHSVCEGLSDGAHCGTDGVCTGGTCAPKQPVISNFSVSPNNVRPGQQVTLSWVVSGADRLSIDQGVGVVSGLEASMIVTVPDGAASIDYTLTATKNDVDAPANTTSKVTVTVSKVNTFVVFCGPNLGDLTVEPGSVTSTSVDFRGTGSPSHDVTWSVEPGSMGSISPAVGPTSVYTAPTTPGTYTVRGTSVWDPSKTDTCIFTVARSTSFTKGMVTFTFDDNLLTQYAAGQLLYNNHFRGTFFLITGRLASPDANGMGWTQVTTLHDAYGHEIGSHTVDHVDLTTVEATTLSSELLDSRSALCGAIHGTAAPACTSLAYPFGTYDGAVLAAAQASNYLAARAFTGDHGSGDPISGPDVHRNLKNSNRYALGTYPVANHYGPDASVEANVKAQIDAAIAEKSWLILVFHNIGFEGGGDWNIGSTVFANIVDYVKGRGTAIDVVTFAEGASLLSG